jgi:two-component sensor histidine kinase
MPADVSIDRPPSLGFKVIVATARQFNAKLEIRRLNPGTEIVIRFVQDFGPDKTAEKPSAA